MNGGGVRQVKMAACWVLCKVRGVCSNFDGGDTRGGYPECGYAVRLRIAVYHCWKGVL